MEDDDFKKRRLHISKVEEELKNPIKITKNIYLESNLSAASIISMTKMILNKMNIDIEDVLICLREKTLATR